MPDDDREIASESEVEDSPSKSGSRWASMAERGSALGLRFLVFCLESFGRRAAGIVLYPVAAYFVATAPDARRASRQYLERLHRVTGAGPEHVGLSTIFRHILTFAEMTLDRLCFWAGRYDGFQIRLHGVEQMRTYLREGNGLVILGAHLGSFDVLRVLARDEKVVVNAVMFTSNAQQINATFKQLDPNSDVRVIEIDPSSVRSAFEIRQCLKRGELVAFLADRIDPAERGRSHRARFLGADVPFPVSPFLLPMVSGSPVALGLALRTGTARYEVIFEVIGKPGGLPRAQREEKVREQIEAYAARLEHYCERAPYQWFNFYDYWNEEPKSVA